MLFANRPSPQAIERFIASSSDLPLSYGPVGLLRSGTTRRRLDEAVATIGRGRVDFDRARAALGAWRQFGVGWVELFPSEAPIEVGTNVAVLIRHFGFWSLNGCRVVYRDGAGTHDARSFGVAYGTLTNHAEAGEELFEVSLDPRTDNVIYRIRAFSRPYVALTFVGYPIVRMLQARFRRDSVEAMRRAAKCSE